MLFMKECNNNRHTMLLGRIEEIEDKDVSIDVSKIGDNIYLRYHRKKRRNPGTPINVD